MFLNTCVRADIARAGEIISGVSSVPGPATSVAFAAGLGTVCYGLRPSTMDSLNSVLVGGVVLTFVVSLSSARELPDCPQAQPRSTLSAEMCQRLRVFRKHTSALHELVCFHPGAFGRCSTWG